MIGVTTQPSDPFNCATRHRAALGVTALAFCALVLTVSARAQSAPTSEGTDALPDWLGQLGDADYRVREAASAKILALGEPAVSVLRARLDSETDPEIRFRLRFILENIEPPDRAAVVLRADALGQLRPGDLITHVGQRRTGSRSELISRLREARGAAKVRVRGSTGPREIGPLAWDDLPPTCDYQVPRGATIARAVRLFCAGYAEQAYELLGALGESVPESELPLLLRAIIAYTAGDAPVAYRILTGHGDAARPLSPFAPWSSPSALDLSGPGKAPVHLEWRLWNEAEAPAAGNPPLDPDVAVQRALIPANRFDDALGRVAALWWSHYRASLGVDADLDRVAGNLLAVSAWMLSEMELWSESLRLIEPRSVILRSAPQGVHKWLRVQTDAWLPFLSGRPGEALDSFYEDARVVLQPPGPPASRIHIQNPHVAATVAFFAYQFPDDERTMELLTLLKQAEHPALGDYARWMLFAVDEGNCASVRAHLLALLPNAADRFAPELARSIALLEYVRDKPDRDVLEAARERLPDDPGDPRGAAAVALVTVLERLAGGQVAEARAALLAMDDVPGVGALRTTVEFLGTPPPGAADIPALRAPLLAVPLGAARDTWIVLTRGRQLVQYRSATGELVPVAKPSPTWFPGPLTWPWLGREPATGRVWVYDRRRVVEVNAPRSAPVALNIRTEDIPNFDRYVAPAWSALVEATGAAETAEGERGEFWRCDLQAGREFFADPALPEVGLVRVLPEDARIVHVALRGGPHLLLDVFSERSWSSVWIGRELGLPAAPRFLAQALRRPADGSPVVYLMSDAGLIRFDLSTERVVRIAFPGETPYPALIPESCPYERCDPRWVYCARLPHEGGAVYRVRVADHGVEALEMVNEVIPRDYYAVQTRASLRAQLDGLLSQSGLPPLREYIADAPKAVARIAEEHRP